MQQRYPYLTQLKALQACTPLGPVVLPKAAMDICTPLHLDQWRELLKSHPDRDFTSYITEGIAQGFRIGCNRSKVKLNTCKHNLLSANEYPHVVDEYLAKELEQGRIADITDMPQAELHVHVSPFGVIPKKHKPGRWRLIFDLSAPEGASVNDGISKDDSSLSYVSIDDIVHCILACGRGSLLAKMDVKEAFRNIPVHPHDRPLLAMRWNGKIYVDKCLPFGLRSAPIIFSAVADALQWMIQQKGVNHIFHYADDFITVGRPGSEECSNNVAIMRDTCTITGTPVEDEKFEGPAPVLPFLGIELDTIKLEIRLPVDKLQRLQQQTKEWRGRKQGKKRDLLSLIGTLGHACKAVRQGRSFLRRLIDVAKQVKRLDHYVRLNVSARSDIQWWYHFAVSWNGISMLLEHRKLNPDVVVTSDASGNWGCGAYCKEEWFQLQWDEATKQKHITVKELIPIVVAAALWGESWLGKSVRVRNDNAAVVAVINSGSSRDQEVMHLMRCLVFISARFNFITSAEHLPGVHNQLADALSRNDAWYFMFNYPQAQPAPSSIPQALIDLLMGSKPDWTSQHWSNLWSTIFNKD